MNFTIKTSELIKSMKEIKKTVNSKTTNLEYLGMFQIVVKNGTVQVASFDFGTTTEDRTSSQVYTVDSDTTMIEQDGGFMIPFSFIEKISKKFKTGFVSFKYDIEKQGLIISHDNNSFVLNDVKEATELLGYSNKELEQSIELDSAEFVRSIGSVLKSVSKQESRPVLQGVHFKGHNNTLKVVATDSHRLTQNSMETEFLNDFDFTLYGKSIKNIISDLKKYTGKIVMDLYSDHVNFKYNNKVYGMLKYDLAYPDTDRIIPENSKTKLRTSGADILECLENALMVSKKDKYNNNIVTMEINKERVTLNSSSEFGQYNGTLKAETSGEKLEILYNPEYLIDAVKPLKDTNITMEFDIDIRPFVIKSDNDKNLIEVVTPIRKF